MDLSNCTTVHHKSTSSKILLSLTLSLLAVLTTAINSLVIAAIIVTKKLHHPANYLICSLAVTDLLVAILVMPVSIVYIIKETWIMGQAMCAIWLGVDITCCTCSILHLAAIALDRYRAITDAVEYSRKRTSLRATLTIGVVWVLSVLISLPPLMWRDQGNHADECLIKHDHIAFTLYSTFGAFYIPLALILVLYYKIYRSAKTLYIRRGTSRLNRLKVDGSLLPKVSDWDSRSPDLRSLPEKSYSGLGQSYSGPEQSYSGPSPKGDSVRIARRGSRFQSRRQGSFKKQRLSGSREKKAATMLGLILGAFIVCWLPFFLKEVIVSICSSCSLPAEMADFLTWLGYLNSLINPLIYTIFNEDFKKAFQKLVACRYYL